MLLQPKEVQFVFDKNVLCIEQVNDSNDENEEELKPFIMTR